MVIKNYISKDLFEKLFVDGIHLITKVRKNMKNKAMDYIDKVILRKRAIIESIYNVLKNTYQI
ncbi:ISPg3 transposase [Polaribacter sp. Hel1_85]|nr:ISPg3 transposase [Polaribacter sp. Hel1_85]